MITVRTADDGVEQVKADAFVIRDGALVLYNLENVRDWQATLYLGPRMEPSAPVKVYAPGRWVGADRS